MIDHIMWSPVDTLLERGLDVATVRHNVISGNIANVDTPSYKRLNVDFASEMRKALTGDQPEVRMVATHRDHFSNPASQAPSVRVYRETSTSQRNDKNGVDVDKEMAYMVENAILYQAMVTQMVKRFQILRTVINEGRK